MAKIRNETPTWTCTNVLFSSCSVRVGMANLLYPGGKKSFAYSGTDDWSFFSWSQLEEQVESSWTSRLWIEFNIEEFVVL